MTKKEVINDLKKYEELDKEIDNIFKEYMGKHYSEEEQFKIENIRNKQKELLRKYEIIAEDIGIYLDPYESSSINEFLEFVVEILKRIEK